MVIKGIITGTAMTKNTPLEVISLNQQETECNSAASEETEQSFR